MGYKKRKIKNIVKERRNVFTGDELPDGLFEPFSFSDWEESGHEDVDFIGKYPIVHFMRVISCRPMGSQSRRTYGEKISLVLQNFADAPRPELLLTRIFELLIKRLYQSRLYANRPPRFVSLQLQNAYMESPFFVPFRTPDQNSARTLAEALLQLNSQSGKKLKLLKVPMNVKIFGVWAFKGRKSKKSKRKKLPKKQQFAGGCGALLAPAGRNPIVRARSLVKIANNDGRCLARSICVAIAREEFGQNSVEFRKMAKNIFDAQTRAAIRLLELAKLPLDLPAYNLKHVRRIQEALNKMGKAKYRIIIFDASNNFRVIYKGVRTARHNLCILLANGHFQPIGRPKELFRARGEYCVECERIVYPNFHPRECLSACRLCYRYGPNRPCRTAHGQNKIRCRKCQFIFPNNDCFSHHIRPGPKGGKPLCEQRYICKMCEKVVYARTGSHSCISEDYVGPEKCEKCQTNIVPNAQHFCYIQPTWMLGAKEKSENARYIFFDIESTQDLKMEINGVPCYKHVANLLIAEVICRNCLDEGVDPGVDFDKRASDCCCGVFGERFRFKRQLLNTNNRRLLQFHDFDNEQMAIDENDDYNAAVDGFLDFLMYSGARETITYAIAHNSGKFDMHVLLERIYARQLAPKMIMTGLKIFSAMLSGSNQRKIIFKDSINFISGPLSSLYDTFELSNIPGVEKKPHFPHFWNRVENLNVELPHLPDAKYYGPDEMGESELAQFLKWHEQNTMTPFLLRIALIEYCRNDVQLLRAACVRFRQIVLQIAPNIEPFECASTIAKLVLEIWRDQHLAPNQLINFPEEGLNHRQRQSVGALRFFKLYSKLTGKTLRTAQWTIGEHRVEGDTGYRVDALILGEKKRGKKVAIEYLGCRFHGCKKCYAKDRGVEISPGRTIEDLYEATQKRKYRLQRRGYYVREVWECQWKQLLKQNSRMKAMWDDTFVAPPFHPRLHALKGGRVEAFRLYAECGSGEVMEHFDVISLYPSVQKDEAYPIGAPVLFGAEQLNAVLNNIPTLPWKSDVAGRQPFRGWMFVRIEAPRRMPMKGLPPFLPYKSANGSLLFPLCAHCAEMRHKSPCKHSSIKRSWPIALTHLDLDMALKLGYIVHEIFEVWHWPEHQWVQGENGLFYSYINAAVKIKVEASGWPADVKTEEDMEQYVQEYLEREGIKLDLANIKLNKGLRLLAKLLANSLWGKLCQQSRRSLVAITRSPGEFHEFFCNEELEVLDVIHLSSNLDRIVYRRRDEFKTAPDTNCIPIAAMVTAHARRRLFSKFYEAVSNGAELIYGDTDSMVIKRKINRPAIKEGQYLGEMQNELPGRRITRFVSAGPKNYVEEHSAPDGTDVRSIFKIRSFQLNAPARQQLNFERILRLVLRKFGPERNHYLGRKTNSYGIAYNKFCRHKSGFVYNRPTVKKYSAVEQKGSVCPNTLIVRPFGYAPEDA